jgi:hypothetical protein
MFALLYSYACYVFLPKSSYDSTYYTSRSFKVEKKNTIDVLCIGSSAIECSVVPSVLYSKHGISALNCAEYITTMDNEIGHYRESKAYQTPKLVLIDTEIVWNGGANTYKTPAQMFFCAPFSNHNRLKSLSWSDFYFHGVSDEDLYYSHLKGYSFVTKTSEMSSWGIDDSTTINNTVSDKNDKAIRSIISEILADNVKILFVTAPEQYSTKDKRHNTSFHSYFESLTEEYDNVSYFDFNDKKASNLNLDVTTDFAKVNHLNVLGAQKASLVLANYLNAKYTLTDYRKDTENNTRMEEGLTFFKNKLATLNEEQLF